MAIQKTITFNGVEYRLMGSGRYYLSQSKSNEGRRGAKSLHVAIWEFYNRQEVSEGYCIHHKDHNTFNNDISNLECVPIKQHLSEHSRENWQSPEYRKKMADTQYIRCKAASEWHRSEEGREWHRKHAHCERKMRVSICRFCGRGFLSNKIDAWFCCEKCGENYRRNYELKYTAICQECGKEFQYGKGSACQPDRKFCCRSCHISHNNRKRKRRV